MIEGPTLCVLIWFAWEPQRGAPIWLLFFAWLIASLLITVKVSSIVAGERGRQTLDVVLTTPMTGRDILRQYYRGVLRLLLVLTIPILTWYAFQYMFRWNITLSYLASVLLGVVIYLPMIAWLAMYFGLRFRSQLKATMVSTLVVVAWLLAPIVFSQQSGLVALAGFIAAFAGVCVCSFFARSSARERYRGFAGALASGIVFVGAMLAVVAFRWDLWASVETSLGDQSYIAIFLSPTSLTIIQETTAVPVGVILINFCWYSAILLTVRAVCLNSADRALGRQGRTT